MELFFVRFSFVVEVGMSRTIVRGSWVDRGYVEFDLHFRFVLFCRSFFFYSEDLFSDMIILLIIAMQWPFASCRKSMLQMVGDRKSVV